MYIIFSQYFHNKYYVAYCNFLIGRLKSNFNCGFKLKLVTMCHLKFVMKIL